ncbi:MAG: cysteine methyltransferase, partial [Pseudomonadota bacterium]|nr:cysteine methyltransferase [Pseudomonadota bacterium]
AIIDSLVAVRGIGRWTVEMLLIFRLGRPDILPLDDYGIRKGYAITFRKRALPDRTQLAGHGDRWKPYRTVASWYLWRALELSRL